MEIWINLCVNGRENGKRLGEGCLDKFVRVNTDQGNEIATRDGNRNNCISMQASITSTVL